MNGLKYMLFGAAGLLLASCSQEEMTQTDQGDGTLNVKLSLPADLATRAESEFGEGYTARMLTVNVYDADNNNSLVFSDPISFGFEANSLSTTVSLDLAKGKNYNIAFFAQSEAAKDVYTIDNATGIITVNYDKMTSDNNLQDYYDCFFALLETGAIPTTTSYAEATLIRPVAQINWGTDDLDNVSINSDQVYGQNVKNLQTRLTTKAYTRFSMLDQDVVAGSNAAEIAISGLKAPASDAYPFPVKPATYEYLSMQYVLAPKAAGVYDLVLTASNAAPQADGTYAQGTYTNEIVVATANVQANYRTNIYGSLLTDNYKIFVEKDPTWNKPDNDKEIK